MRDVLEDVAALIYKDVVREPVVREANEADNCTSAPGVRSVWQPQAEVLFDVRVEDTIIQSTKLLVATEKKKKCTQAAQMQHRCKILRFLHLWCLWVVS